MEIAIVPIKNKESTSSSTDNQKDFKASSIKKQKGIDNHKSAAYHHEQAATHHLEAARHHEEDNDKKASESMVKALGHHYLASEAEREDIKYHASKK